MHTFPAAGDVDITDIITGAEVMTEEAESWVENLTRPGTHSQLELANVTIGESSNYQLQHSLLCKQLSLHTHENPDSGTSY